MRRPQLRYDLGRLPVRFLAAWLVIAGVQLVEFGDSAVPASFLMRPLLVAAAAAFTVSVVTGFWYGGLGVLLAIAVTLAGVDTEVGALMGAMVGILAFLLRRRNVSGVARGMLVVVGMFFLVSAVTAIRQVDLEAAPAAEATSGPQVYLILLDGYPRVDTLAALGIDVSEFVKSLEARGFDHYQRARALHSWTHLTLTALFTGRIEPDRRGSNVIRRSLRNSWELPPGWAVVAPPIGHVNIPHAASIHDGGMNNYEAHLIGRSILGRLPIGGWLVMNGLRDRLENAMTAVSATSQTRVFAHLMAPHPPFLYQSDGNPKGAPICWPRCQIFAAQIEELGVSRAEWAAAETGNLAHLNEMLLGMVDKILVRSPDAVIVLFSDHGGRISTGARGEWHRSFLLARTPGHPRLFGDNPQAHNLLRELEAAY